MYMHKSVQVVLAVLIVIALITWCVAMYQMGAKQ